MVRRKDNGESDGTGAREEIFKRCSLVPVVGAENDLTLVARKSGRVPGTQVRLSARSEPRPAPPCLVCRYPLRTASHVVSRRGEEFEIRSVRGRAGRRELGAGTDRRK